MGQVYLAEHVKMGRRSAIKVMNPSMVHDPDAVARFNREASNASRITHPNVCAIYDFGETPDGLIYLAMEFIEGEPLTDLIEREGALPVTRAAAIFLQTADARPDLSLPPGLQPVLDTALARTPTERYQSVAKFAADVAAVTGRPTASAVPHTRSMGDTEGKTQLLDTTAGGATQRISAQQA